MIDLSTRFMQAAWLGKKASKDIIEVIDDRWISYFGTMRKVIF